MRSPVEWLLPRLSPVWGSCPLSSPAGGSRCARPPATCWDPSGTAVEETAQKADSLLTNSRTDPRGFLRRPAESWRSRGDGSGKCSDAWSDPIQSQGFAELLRVTHVFADNRAWNCLEPIVGQAIWISVKASDTAESTIHNSAAINFRNRLPPISPKDYIIGDFESHGKNSISHAFGRASAKRINESCADVVRRFVPTKYRSCVVVCCPSGKADRFVLGD